MRSPIKLSQFANFRVEVAEILEQASAHAQLVLSDGGDSLRELVLALAPAAAVLCALVLESKHVSALAQSGGINTRAYHSKQADAKPKSKGKGPRVVVTPTEKLVYSLGVMNVGVTMYLCGQYPHRFFLWHTVKYLAMFTHRFVTFRRTGDHYFLWDFCYWANWLSLAFAWGYPHDPLMFRILFIAANGPLAWSVLAFNNSLIFHSAAHMTSAFIHISPMLLSYCVRWTASPLFTPCEDMMAFPRCDEEVWAGLVKPTITHFYVPWAAVYTAALFVVLARRVEKKGYTTLFTYVSGLGGARLFAFVSGNLHIQKAFFMMCHYSFATCTMFLACVFWHHKTAHTLFCLMICFGACWNGASYYLRVLEQRTALLKLHQEDAAKEQ